MKNYEAVYAGSFDPITKGHIDVILQTIKMFGWCNVFIADNSKKSYMCDADLRKYLIIEAMKEIGENRVSVVRCKGLVVDKAAELLGDDAILVRGIRNVTDMIAEMALADTNEEISEGIKTIFIPTANENRNFSSSLVKELWENGKDISKYVPKVVAEMMNERKR